MIVQPPEKFDVTTRVLHLGLAVFGTWAWWLGDGAHDYHRTVHSGYIFHMWIGLCFSACLAARLMYGFFGPQSQRFAAWLPVTRARWAAVLADVRMLLRLRLPAPVSHQGLSGAIQALALLLFTWQGGSGVIMSLAITPGERIHGWVHLLKEIHGTAGVWIPAYLVLHVGATVLHALTGHQIWKKMLFLGRT